MEKFLIIKISSLGDVLHAFPAVSLLASHFPKAEIDWLVHPSFAQILGYNRHVRRIILFPRKELGSPFMFPRAFSRLVGDIRKEKYDMVIDMQGLFRSAFFAKFAKSGSVAGFAEPREKLAALFYDKKIKIDPCHVHAVERNARLIASLFNVPLSTPRDELPVNAESSLKLRELLGKKGVSASSRIISVSPGGRWETKCWPPEFFASVIDKASQSIRDAVFLILGAPDEKETSMRLASSCKSARTCVIAGETGIGELVEAIRISESLLCNDSGPMHIAACLGTPVCALFGPTDPDRTGPYGKIHFVFQPDLGCIKCLKRYCPQQNFRCHSSIDPEKVAEKMISLSASKLGAAR